MEFYDEQRMGSYFYKARESEETRGNTLEVQMEELTRTREELKRAKDIAMQSWLDSRPFIDELERLKSALASAKNQTSISNVVLSEIESQLETANKCIQSKMEEELKATKMINEIGQSLDQTGEELERLKLETDEEQRETLKLKQVLRLKRQTLRTLQLTARAARIESEAFAASAAEALHQINNSEMDITTVKLTQEEYDALKRRAKEETSLADWRISVSMEQKIAVEASRNSALSRLKGSHSGIRSRRRRIEEENISGDGEREAGEQDPSIREGSQLNNRGFEFPKARAKLISESGWENPQQQKRRSKSSNNKRLIKKKKTSILLQIRRCIVRNITRLFG